MTAMLQEKDAMQASKSIRPAELVLATYGSPLRKPLIGWGLGAALPILIIYSLEQLLPFFDLAKPQSYPDRHQD